MQISTTVRMDMNDVQEAVVALLSEKINIPEGVDPDIHFDAENDIFVIEFQADDAATSSDGEKKTRRKRRSRAEIEADEKAAQAAAAAKVDETQAAEQPAEEPETKAEEPPFDTDTSATSPAEPASQETEAGPAEKEAAPIVAKIFSDPASSAAPTPEPEPVVAAKSLFANLTKPVNGAH